MKLTVVLSAVLFLGVFEVAAHEKTLEEQIAETMADAEEDIQYEIDKYARIIAHIEEDDEELEAERVADLEELTAKHKRKWIEYDDDCDYDRLGRDEYCEKYPDKCAKKSADLELKHEDEYNYLLDKLTKEKNDFELYFFKKCTYLEEEAKDAKEDMAETISNIYVNRDEKIADYIEDDEADKLKILEDQERRAAALHAEFRAKVNQVKQELEECLAFELVGVERLMTADEIKVFEREVPRAMRQLMQQEGIDCDVLEIFGTINYDLEDVSDEHHGTERKLGRRQSKTRSKALFNIQSTCSSCPSCECLPIEGNRRALADELITPDSRILKYILKDKLTHKLSNSQELKEVFPELEKVDRIKCEDEEYES